MQNDQCSCKYTTNQKKKTKTKIKICYFNPSKYTYQLNQDSFQWYWLNRYNVSLWRFQMNQYLN